MSTPTATTMPDDTFVCECKDEWMRSACPGKNFYKERDGKRYCILHYPGTEKTKGFECALQQKLDNKDFNFQGVWFPDDVSFENFTFTRKTDFRGAVFCEKAYFSGARFNADAFFHGAQFNEQADFRRARFSEKVSFRGAHFNADAYFSGAQISGKVSFVSVAFNANVYFGGISLIREGGFNAQGSIGKSGATSTTTAVEAKTIDINFKGASFKETARFKENKFTERACLRFANTIFEKPERATFQNTALCPHWFINVDPRKFTFVNVDWGCLNKRGALRKEIAALERSGAGDLSDLEITFRQLAVNAEENNRYEQAADFRYMAMEAKRRQMERKVDLFRLSWWYWLLSGYGERVTRALGALVVIWLLFAVIYWSGNATWWQPKQSARLTAAASTEQDRQQPAVAGQPQQASAAALLTFTEALIHSAGVMTLQKPEPLPANKRAKAFVLFETILGPLQAALLALAIRRKFMR